MVVISRYNEDISWIDSYQCNFIIYNKGEHLERYNCISKPNIGNNQRDICEYIYDNYDRLPDIIRFLQGYPFDHCKKETFDKIIYNENLTRVEEFRDHPNVPPLYLDSDGFFREPNNNHPIISTNEHYKQSCKYESFDSFMNSIFVDYSHVDFISFSPGSQYIVPKENILYYSKEFWKYLMNTLNRNFMTEAHIMERALWYIFSNKYKSRF